MSGRAARRAIGRLAELSADADLEQVVFAVVRSMEERRTKDSRALVQLLLADTTATISAVIFDERREALAAARALAVGDVVKVAATTSRHDGRLQLNVQKLRPAQPDDQGYCTDVLFGEGFEQVRDLLCDTLVFDIETVPNVDRRTLPPSIAATLAKKTERGERTERTEQELDTTMSTSPFFGKVISLAVADGDARLDEQLVTVLAVPPPKATVKLPVWLRPVSEPELLHAFWCLARHARRVVTFNGRGFDVPFLIVRSLVHGIPVPIDLLGKPHELRPHLDLYRLLTEGGRLGPGGLEVTCWALGIDSPKGDMDGSMVAPAYERGDLEKIATYNAADVRATTAVYQRVRDLMLPFRADG